MRIIKMKKIMTIVMVLLLLPMVNAYTFELVEDVDEHHNNKVVVYHNNVTIEKKIFNNNTACRVEMRCNVTEYQNYISYWASMSVDDYEAMIYVPPKENLTNIDTIDTEQVISHQYLYGSEGFNADNIPTSQIRTILGDMQVQQDGQINKSTYHNKMVEDINGTSYEKSGVVRSFIIIVLQRLDGVIDSLLTRMGVIENKANAIEDELCQKYPNGQWSWC